MAGAKLTIELNVKNLSEKVLKDLNIQLNGVSIEAKKAFYQANAESKKFTGSMDKAAGVFKKFGAAYLGIGGVKQLFSLMTQSSEQFKDEMETVRKSMGGLLVDMFNAFGGSAITNQMTGFFAKVREEMALISPSKDNAINEKLLAQKQKELELASKIKDEYITTRDETTGMVFTTKITADQQKKILEAEIGRLQKQIEINKQAEEELRTKQKTEAAEKRIKDLRDDLAKLQGTYVYTAQEQELKNLEEKIKKLKEIEQLEKSELVKRPVLGISDRNLQGQLSGGGMFNRQLGGGSRNVVAAGLANTELEKFADARIEVYGKLISAQNEWANNEGQNLKKVEKEYDRITRMTVEFGVDIGRAMAEGFGKGSEGVAASMRAMLITGIDFLERLYQESVLAELLKASFSWSGAFAAAAKIAVVTAELEAVKAGVNSFAPRGYASGTPFAPGGMARVGESGPEDVYLPRGARVYNSHETRNISNGNTVNVYLPAGSTTETAREAARSFKKLQREGYLDDFMIRTVQFAS